MARFVADTTPPASAVSNTPAGDIAATNVQAAINELDGEKLSASGQALSVTDHGTKLSGAFTPEPSDGYLQECVNGGAFTLAPPTEVGFFVLIITNNASAGAITDSGFDNVRGDSFDATDGNVFECVIGNDGTKTSLQVTADTGNT
jgi:hypothetical protein